MLTNLAMKMYDAKFSNDSEFIAAGSIQYMQEQFKKPFDDVNALQQSINTLRKQTSNLSRPLTRSEYNTVRRKGLELERDLLRVYDRVQQAVDSQTFNSEICVSTRTKTPERILSKIAAVPLEHLLDSSKPTQVKDLFGMRVVVKEDKDIDPAVRHYLKELKKVDGILLEKPSAYIKEGHSSLKLYVAYTEGKERIMISTQFQTCKQNLQDKRTHLKHEEEREEFFREIRERGCALDKFLAVSGEIILPQALPSSQVVEEPSYSFV
jgi:ppGpp synthetase/RelA/SpoT-type nucleotidyltranferase